MVPIVSELTLLVSTGFRREALYVYIDDARSKRVPVDDGMIGRAGIILEDVVLAAPESESYVEHAAYVDDGEAQLWQSRSTAPSRCSPTTEPASDARASWGSTWSQRSISSPPGPTAESQRSSLARRSVCANAVATLLLENILRRAGSASASASRRGFLTRAIRNAPPQVSAVGEHSGFFLTLSCRL